MDNCHAARSSGDATAIMRRMKTMLDWLPALAFVAAYVVYDIYVATMVLIGALFLAVAVHRLHTGEWHKTNLVAACVALRAIWSRSASRAS